MVRRFAWPAVGAAVVAGAVLAVWTFGRAQPAPTPPAPLVSRDVVFAQPGGVTLRLDLARPAEGQGPFPAVVCLHGGGWVGGDRRQMAQTVEALARRGFVAVAPDYRLAPAHRFPAQLEDCQAAVRWLRANAGAYRIDPRRVGVVGIAAGGHLACLLGVEQSEGAQVQAVVSFFGPTDLTQPVWGKVAVEKNLVPLLGGTVEQVPDAYRSASPALRVHGGAPPFLFLHGSDDRTVPPAQSEDMARKLREAGRSARVVLLEGEGHTWQGHNLRRSIAEMLVFLDEALKQCP